MPLQQTQPTKVAGTLRRAVRIRVFARIPGGRHIECAYYFVDGTWNVPTNLTFVGCVPLQLEFSLTSCIILGLPGLPPCVPPFASNPYSRRFRFYA
jgi:hypothetical protein